MRYRVDELAAGCGLSVDTVRFYQAKGLLPPPRREGRVAWYSDDHLECLRRIRELKDKGFTLSSIRRLLTGDLDPADEALVAALASPDQGLDPDSSEEILSPEELAERTGVSPTLLEALEREGLLTSKTRGGKPVYTSSDAATVTAGLALLQAGLPLSELLALAREHDEAMRKVARRAVDLFARFVRDPIRAQAPSQSDAGERLVQAFRQMLPATSTLVAHHFRRVLLAAAQERITSEGLEGQIEAGPEEPGRELKRA